MVKNNIVILMKIGKSVMPEVDLHKNTHTHMHAYTHAYTHTQTHTHTHIRTYILTHTHTHTHTHTLHTHTHERKEVPLLALPMLSNISCSLIFALSFIFSIVSVAGRPVCE